MPPGPQSVARASPNGETELMQSLPNRTSRGPLTCLAFMALAACAPAAVHEPTPVTVHERTPATAVVDAAATITADGVGRQVHALAHDSARGRDTPSPELEKAALYIEHRFRDLGLEPAGEDGSYIHRWDFDVVVLDRETTTVQVAGHQTPVPTYEADYFLAPGVQPRASGRAYYAGSAGEAQAVHEEARGRFIVFDLPGPELNAEWQQRLTATLQPAMMSAAAGLILVLDPDFPRDMVAQLAPNMAAQRAPFPVIGIAAQAAADLFTAAGANLAAIRAAGEPAPLGEGVLEVTAERVEESHRPPNVAAMRRGSDPALADTYIILTAHFDHLGVGEPDERGDSIFSGADDNASGTAALMEIAAAFASLPEAPARSVIFLAVSGEEKGLLGSMAFAEDPTVPLDAVVANINLDMVGRSAPDTVIAIGQEYTTLEGVISRIVSEHPDLRLTVIQDPQPEQMFFFRSDQLSFIQRGIPAVFFTTGDHPDYHQQSDLPERVDTDKLARVARLAFHLAYEIAVDPEAPDWTEEGRGEVRQMLQGSPF